MGAKACQDHDQSEQNHEPADCSGERSVAQNLCRKEQRGDGDDVSQRGHRGCHQVVKVPLSTHRTDCEQDSGR